MSDLVSQLLFYDFYSPSYLDDDGQSIEPKFYMPVIPMALVNGRRGVMRCGAAESAMISWQIMSIVDNFHTCHSHSLKELKVLEPAGQHPSPTIPPMN